MNGSGLMNQSVAASEYVNWSRRVGAHRRAGDEFTVRRAVDALVDIDPDLVEGEMNAILLSTIALLWQNGWQPAELIRHVRRCDAQSGRLAVIAVAADHA